MATYKEYSTVFQVRKEYKDSDKTKDDSLFLKKIREASRMIETASGYFFYPLVKTVYFDARRDVRGSALWLNEWPLLSATTVTNGDTTTVSASNYVTEPRNTTPYNALTLKASSGLTWTYDTDPENAIYIAGIWGYHPDYSNAWVDSSGTVQNATQIAAAGTSLTIQTGKIKAGHIIRFGTGTDYAYVSALVEDETNDTATLVRGVNGSTAANQLNGTAVYIWTPDDALVELCSKAAVALYDLRDNPTMDSVAVDGRTILRPRDIGEWVEQEVYRLGLKRY